MNNYLFDSISGGMIHYYAKPKGKDDFVINSLEKLDSSGYLYRVLKAKGYERIIFIEGNQTNYGFYAYDKFSHLTFIADEETVRSINTKDKNSIENFYKKMGVNVSGNSFHSPKQALSNTVTLPGIIRTTAQGGLPAGLNVGTLGAQGRNTSGTNATTQSTNNDTPEYGKREIRHFGSISILISEFTNNISRVLKSENIKTAVILEMELFEELATKKTQNLDSVTSGEIAQCLREIDNKKRNILIFSTESIEESLEITRDSQVLQNIHSWSHIVLTQCETNFVDGARKYLKDHNMLCEADSIGVDEIANLLLRKKTIEKDDRLTNLPISKIYPIAEKLKSHLLQKEEVFKTISYFKVEDYINTLDAWLNEDAFISEILQVCEKISPREINVIEDISSLEVERVTHQKIPRAKNASEEEIYAELNKLFGMEGIAEQIKKFVLNFEARKNQYLRKVANGEKAELPYLNLRFIGPPGTGKTTVAEIVAKILQSKGLLSSGDVVSKKPADFPSHGTIGVVEAELGSAIDEANGGVFVLDEVYNFDRAYNGGNVATEALSAIMDRTDKYKNSLCMIVAGYQDDVEKFLAFNPGAPRRFPNTIVFESYSTDVLIEIFKKSAAQDGIAVSDDAEKLIRKIIEAERCKRNFGNVGFIKDDLLQKINSEYLYRNAQDNTYTAEDVINAFGSNEAYKDLLNTKEQTEEEIYAELTSLSGMDNIAEQIKDYVRVFEARKNQYLRKTANGEKAEMPYLNLRFIGPPGTGKTTVAEIVSKILRTKKLLTSGVLVSKKPADFPSHGTIGVVEAELGSTIDEANGGVFVLDEVYNFDRAYNGGNVATEALSAIMDRTDKYKNSLCMIVAGYQDDVEKFLAFNPGAPRRFPNTIVFESYSTDVLIEIFKKSAAQDGIAVSDDAERLIRKIIEAERCKRNFGNVGFVKDDLLQKIHAQYLYRSANDNKYIAEDVINAFGSNEAYKDLLNTKEQTEEEIYAELTSLSGMDKIAEQIKDYVRVFEDRKNQYLRRVANGEKAELPYLNLRFIGPPGTGKTTVAEIVSKILRTKKLLTSGVLVSKKPADFPSHGTIGIVEENLGSAIDEANGGVFVLDEVYNFDRAYDGGNMANEALSAIMDRTDKYKNTLCMIVAGYQEDVDKFLAFNPGAPRRFPNTIVFESYSTDVLIEIFRKSAAQDGISVSDDAERLIRKIIEAERCKRNFGNVGFVKDDLLQKIHAQYLKRAYPGSAEQYTAEDVINAFGSNEAYKDLLNTKEQTVEEIYAELTSLSGMDKIAEQIKKYVRNFEDRKNQYLRRVANGEKAELPYLNLRFIGPPGTGKTTVAEIVSKILRTKKLLTSGVLVSKKPADFPSHGTIGVVEEKLGSAIDEANGGVFVLDEVYNFDRAYNGGNVATEALSAIMDRTDKYKNSLCMIVAGYQEDVDKFLAFNAGAPRRFPNTIVFESYSTDILLDIFKTTAQKDDLTVSSDALPFLADIINAERAKPNFGNVGYIKDDLYEKIHSEYLNHERNDGTITLSDVSAAFPITNQNSEGNTPTYRKVQKTKLLSLPQYYPSNDYHTREHELRKLIKPSILYIKTDSGSGTAFLISPEGYAITCNHVIKNAKKITARLRIEGRIGGNDSYHNCTVVNANPQIDMALLKLEGDNFPYLPLALNDRDYDGEQYLLSGYPLGISDDVTTYTGSIANAHGFMDDGGIQYFFIEGEAKKGNSGSPLVSISDGKVIGILIGSIIDEHDEMNKMRPIRYFGEDFVE